jgi:hypothetical protein
MTAASTDTRLGAMYRRIARKRGKQKAIVAVSRVIGEIAWILICDPGAWYQELGADYHHPRSLARQTRDKIREIERLNPGRKVILAAVATGKTATREGARYRKLARSRGKGKAQVAVGNTQLRVYHKLLSNPGMRYQDLGPDYYERQAATRRKIAYHVREIEALGLEVTLARIPDPDPDRPASTPAA